MLFRPERFGAWNRHPTTRFIDVFLIESSYMRTILYWAMVGIFGLSAFFAQADILGELRKLTSISSASPDHQFLHPDEAFLLVSSTAENGNVIFSWSIKPGYYLYRDKFKVVVQSEGITIGPARLPAGVIKDDPDFGRVYIFFDQVEVKAEMFSMSPSVQSGEFEISYQGCADGGICYPPMTKTVSISLNADQVNVFQGGASAPADNGVSSESERIAAVLPMSGLFEMFSLFIGFGLLLSFTPCVLPMVPILSGIIVGKGGGIGAARASMLSVCYVLSVSATYAVFGVLAGTFGQNLQIFFQHPFSIVLFCLLFVALAFSMFGFYDLRLPSSVVGRLSALSSAQKGGSMAGVVVMGILSALVVGPCIAPPLAGVLIYIGQEGSALKGGVALFALGLGMGVPLILAGLSAGVLLPRAGPWMVFVQRSFGFVFLALAVWFLSRIVEQEITELLWAGLAICAGIFLWRSYRWGRVVGVVFQLWALVLIANVVLQGNGSALLFWPNLEEYSEDNKLDFTPIKGLSNLNVEIEKEGISMLELYADWCVECKHLERETFGDKGIRHRLVGFRLLRADVTNNDDLDQALLRELGLFGPPAVLFFKNGVELRHLRLIGFADPQKFGKLLVQVDQYGP